MRIQPHRRVAARSTADLHLSPTQGGLVSGIFFWGYVISLLSAGWLAPRFGPKRLIFMILLVWGFFAMATGFVTSFYTLLVMRFVLGVAEGPAWPCLVLLLSQWFVQHERARAFGFWQCSMPIAAVLSGPISGLVLTYANWHMMFVLEGLPAWIFAIVWWRVIPDSVDSATWLAPSERQALQEELVQESSASGPTAGLWKLLAQPMVWMFVFIETSATMLTYAFTLWLPTVLKEASNASIASVGLLSAVPYIAGAVGMLLIARSSDRSGDRRIHIAVPLIVISVLLFIGSRMDPHMISVQMMIFTVIGLCLFMNYPIIAALIMETFPRPLAIPAVAFAGCLSNLFGGFGGPVVVGWLKGVSGDFSLAFVLLAGIGVLGGLPSTD